MKVAQKTDDTKHTFAAHTFFTNPKFAQFSFLVVVVVLGKIVAFVSRQQLTLCCSESTTTEVGGFMQLKSHNGKCFVAPLNRFRDFLCVL